MTRQMDYRSFVKWEKAVKMDGATYTGLDCPLELQSAIQNGEVRPGMYLDNGDQIESVAEYFDKVVVTVTAGTL